MATNDRKGQEDLVEKLLRELIFWVRFSVRGEAKEWFENTLDSDEKKRVYEALDGQTSFRDVEKSTSVPVSTIASWAREWEELGIAHGVGEGWHRRMRRTVPLQSVGIQLPPLPTENKE